ncbi:MAG TPA: four helix bundle protein [Candidatus Saccharibacteria bacterium]|nr:four helix bundle protein [Candidatus Saccharibacteria bacterium]
MEELSVIQTTYEVHKKLAELNATLNQTYRHTLSEPAVRRAQATLRQLILAKHAPKTMKKPYLLQAEAEAELTALLLRTMLELKLANETNLLKLQAKLTEARRQIGGWRKSL